MRGESDGAAVAQTMYGKVPTPTVGNSPHLIALSIARVRDQTSFRNRKVAHPLRYNRSDPVGAPYRCIRLWVQSRV